MTDALDQATAKVDQCWADHEGTRGPLREELREILRSSEGTTGLQPGPGAENLIERVLAFGEAHAEELDRSNLARIDALNAQAARDVVAAEEPFEEPPANPGDLESMTPTQARTWLRTANDAQVSAALSGVSTTERQRELALQLMQWGRADGNQAQVFAAINQFLTPANAALVDAGVTPGGTGATTTYEQVPESASADDEPATRDDAHERAVAEADVPPSDDPDVILEWVNAEGADSVARAVQMHEAETQRTEIRTELLDELNAIIEGGADADASPADSTGEPGPTGEPAAKPYYVHVGVDEINADAWQRAAVNTTEGEGLYTYFEDEPGGEPTGASGDWVVYEGDVTH